MSIFIRMLVLFYAAAALSVPAQAKSLSRIVLAVDGTSETRNLPVLLAERLGYFRDQGLIVTLVDAPADPSPAQLVKDGRADGAVAFFHHTFMNQIEDNVATRAVIAMGVTPGLKVLVAARLRSEIGSIAALKGRRIFTGGNNSGKTTTANWMMLHAGMAISDYTPLPLASRDEMSRALRDGSADGIVAHEPDASFYLASGTAFELADVESAAGTQQTLGSLFPSTALYMPQVYIDHHPAEVQQLVNALLKALQFINSHDSAAIANALPARMLGKDRAAFLQVLSADKLMFATDGRMASETARGLLTAMAALNPRYRSVNLTATYTNAFVDRAAR